MARSFLQSAAALQDLVEALSGVREVGVDAAHAGSQQASTAAANVHALQAAKLQIRGEGGRDSHSVW